MTRTKKHDLTPALNRHGQQMRADGGTSKGALRPMKKCGGCDQFVAWVQNSDGRWYIVDCYRYGSQAYDGRYYYRADCPHRCEPQQADVESVEQAQQRRKAEMWRWRDERDEQGIKTTREESLAYLAMLEARDEAGKDAR